MKLKDMLTDRDNTAAYRLLKELEAESEKTDSLYECFDEFLDMVSDERSYVRIRGVRMCCAQARWDIENKIRDHFDALTSELFDDRPTAVRQCLAALHTVIAYKPELCGILREKIGEIDTAGYKDTMRPLIEKDIIYLSAEIDRAEQLRHNIS